MANGKQENPAKTFLKRYININRRINRKLEEIERLKSLAVKTTQTIKRDRVQTSPKLDKTGDIVAKIVELEDEINRSVDKLVIVRAEIEQMIASLEDDRLRLLLEYRYIDGFKLDKIAVLMDYSYIQICRLHGTALKQVKDDIQ